MGHLSTFSLVRTGAGSLTRTNTPLSARAMFFTWVTRVGPSIYVPIQRSRCLFYCKGRVAPRASSARFARSKCRCTVLSSVYGCGRQLRLYTEPLDPLSSFLDSAQGGLGSAKGTEYDVDDLGRFPRARPISTPGNTEGDVHISPSIQHADPLNNDREQPFDSDKQSDVFLNWRNQVHGFTRFSTDPYSRPFASKDGSELFVAAEHGHYALVNKLLQLRDVDIDASAGGFTALHLATLGGHARVVKLLLDYGATVDAVTEDDDTPLAFAVRFSRPELAALLLARGSMVNASERVRAVVFFDAARSNDLSIVRTLLHLGLNVDVLMHGQTALHTALRFGHRDVVQVLLQNRADATVRDGCGDTALSIVARQGQASFETLALLCASGATIKCASPSDSKRLFYRAVGGGSLSIVEMVLQHTRTDVNERFEDGSTPLSLASELGHDEVVALLLAQGADPNAEAMPSQKAERQGLWKALHAAARNGHVKVVQVLLQRGADVNARAENSDTALLLAVERDPPQGVVARAELDHDKTVALAFAKKGKRIPSTWRTKASDYDRIVSMLLSGGAVMDDRSSLLLKEMESGGNSSVGRPDLEVPGAWR
ncbi:ankyrin [Peniophora sp. CONT]|nr:ankyrin [Peniophora sp. CONT]